MHVLQPISHVLQVNKVSSGKYKGGHGLEQAPVFTEPEDVITKKYFTLFMIPHLVQLVVVYLHSRQFAVHF